MPILLRSVHAAQEPETLSLGRRLAEDNPLDSFLDNAVLPMLVREYVAAQRAEKAACAETGLWQIAAPRTQQPAHPLPAGKRLCSC